MRLDPRHAAAPLLAGILLAACVPVGQAQIPPTAPAPGASLAGTSAPTYADLATLADTAPLVVHARIRKLARVDDAQARGLKPGTARFYVMADTQALITGRSGIGQSVAYLVDLPLDRRGKPSARKKDEVIVFARSVPGRPGELQLVRPDAQIDWTPQTQEQVRAIVTALVAPDAPARITGVRELLHVPGNLAGEGETQIFFNTASGSAASLTVRHQPNQPPQWGVSFSELVAQVGSPPARDTLEWYRLACFLPASPPPGANVSEGAEARRIAEADYRMVIASLGPCRRTT